LTEHFELCGPIEICFVATFEDSGKCKGYGWVTFGEIEAAEAAVKGFVMVPEVDEDEDDEDGIEENAEEKEEDDKEDEEGYIPIDSKEPDSDEADSANEDEPKPKAPRAPKPRMQRRFVNRIHGRPLRVEFAEDPQTRYKKRYGKDGTKVKSAASESATGEAMTVDHQDDAKHTPIKKAYHSTPWAHRLTGGIVESKGKKQVFS